MDESVLQLQSLDYTPFIAGSYVISGLVLLWVLWRSVSALRNEKRNLERLK